MIVVPDAFTALPIVPTSSNGIAPGVPIAPGTGSAQAGDAGFLALMFQMLATWQSPGTSPPAAKKDKNSIADGLGAMPGVALPVVVNPANLTAGTKTAATPGQLPLTTNGVKVDAATTSLQGANVAQAPGTEQGGAALEPGKTASNLPEQASQSTRPSPPPQPFVAPTIKPAVVVVAPLPPTTNAPASQSESNTRTDKPGDDVSASALADAVRHADAPRGDAHARVEEARPAAPIADQVQDQVARHLDQLREQGHIEVQMNLHPPELGRVQLHLALDDGKLSVRFVVQNDGARTALTQQMEPMRVRFAEMGFSLGSFDVRRDNDSSKWQEAPESDGAGQLGQVQRTASRGTQQGYGPLTDASGMVDVMA